MSSGSKKRKRLPGDGEVRYAGQRRRSRAGLMATTALQAGAVLLLAFPVRAQPAPNARPQGGVVVGGQASIAQSTAQTTIAQTSQRAAIDWRSYDVGQAHTVTYQQPNASSITLNRVNSPNPSQIAGRIQANGQVAIVNQSGVVFMNGSQVDVQSLVVSSANISNANFMAGRMVFDQPGRPDAKISNAGTITVKATGLAALVAPQVQNSGVINAKLGHVVLAGAEAHTVDLYGDGLMSVDVTRQVQKAPDGKTVLVTNSGTIAADGGTIVLTAQAADGIVTNLVSNTGRLRANSVGDKPGTIVMSAVGGSISIEGAVEANGRAANGVGGTVALVATDTVALGATARVSASGRAGGGTVAIGTSPERARNQGGGVPAGSARAVTVAAGARIAADGRGTGSGGSVALLATDHTSMAGTITARGGKTGGDGGQVEVSSGNTFALTGTIDVGAPAGKLGNILIDPRDITIGTTGANDAELVSGGGTINANLNSGTDYTISDAAISGFTGNVTLQASRNLFVAAGTTVNLRAGSSPQALTLQAGNNLSVSGAAGSLAAASVNASGAITLAAGGALDISGPVSGASVRLSAPSLNLAAGVTAPSGGTVGLNTDALTLGQGAAVSAAGGTVAIAPFTPATDLRVQGGSGTSGLSLDPGAFTTLAPVRGGPALLVLGDTSATPSAATAQAANVVLQNGFTLNVPTLGLYATGSVSQADTFSVTNLTGASGGATALALGGNRFTSLGRYTAGTSTNAANADFRSDSALTVSGPVTATGGTLTLASPASLTLNGALTGNAVALTANTLTVNAGATVAANSVAVAPISGTAVSVDLAKGTTGLSLTPDEIGRLAPIGTTTLILGSTAGTPASTSATASSIGINTPLAVNATNFGLYTSGAIAQTAKLTAGTLFGGSGGNTTLTAGNAVGTLGNFTSGGSFSLLNGPTLLSVTGLVQATGGDVSLQSVTGLALSGTVYSSGTIRLQTGGTFTQSGGIVAAAGGDLFVTGIGSDFTPTGGAVSQIGGTLAASGRVRLYSGGDARFSGTGTVAGNDIEVIAPLGDNGFAGASGPKTGKATIMTDPALSVTLGARPATLRLDGGTITIGGAIAADRVELHSTGSTTQSGGSVTADTLTGTAGLGPSFSSTGPAALPSYGVPAIGSALLDKTTNAVNVLNGYIATSGFTLDNGANMLNVNAGVTVSTGALALRATNLVLNGGISLTAPRIELAADAIMNSPGQLHILPTGALAISPYSAGAYTIGAPIAGETAISVAQIQSLLPSSVTGGNSITKLQLGGTSATPASVAAGPSQTLTPTTTLTINDALDLTGRADTLALNGRTAVTETSTKSITVGTLSGGSGGTFQVDASSGPAGPFYNRSFSNGISQLGSITAAGDTSIASNLNLSTLSGTTITAGAGTVTLTTPGALTIGGTLGAGGGVGGVALNAVTGISQSVGGSIQTGTLSGFVGDATAAVTTGRNAVLTAPTNQVATLGTFTTAQGNFSLIDNQALTVAAGATVTGRNVTLTTNGTALAMAVNGAIGACATTASLNGMVTLTSTGALTISGPGAVVGGERATNLAGASNIVANGAFVEAGRSGTPAYDGTIAISNGLVLQGGTVAAATVTSSGGINQSGGVLSATTLTPGGYTFSGGQVYSGTALTLAASVLGAGTGPGTGDVISAPSLTINAAPGYTSFGTIISPGNIQINLGGSFTQAAGTIYAGGNLTLSALSNTPGAGLIAQSGGLLGSANTTELYAGAAGAVSIAGGLSGQVVQVLEPAATLTFAPSTLAATAAPVTFPGYAVQFHCPGCETPATLPSGVPTTASVAVSGTTPLLRVDAGTLTLAAPVTANTVELHSVGATIQTAGAPITTGAAGVLTGTAGYAVTIPLSGLPTWDSPVTVGSAVLTNPLNSVPVAGPYYTGGGLAVASAVPSFTVKDLLVAGGGQSIALTNTQANGLLTIDGVNSGLLTFGSVRGGNFATNPHPNVRGVGVVTQSTVNPVTSPSQVALTADQLSLIAPGANVLTVDARGGIVSIAPFSANRAVSIDASRIAGASTLSLGAGDLAHINTLGTTADVGLLGPRTIRVGSTDGTLTNAAASVTLNTNFVLNNQAAALALYAKGDITESPASSATPGSLSIGRTGIAGTVTGAAGGTVTLGSTTDAAPANHFDVLGPFAAGNGLTVSDTPDANAGRSGMLVQGTVSSGTGALGLLDVGQVLGGVRVGGTIAIGGTLDATGQSLTLVAQNGPGAAPAITEAANGTILAGSLTGAASTNDPVLPASLAYDVRLDTSATNRIDTLNQFVVGTGPVTAVSAQGAFRLSDAAALAVNGPVVAKSVAISANGMTVVGPIGACLVGGSGGDIVLKQGPITIRSGTVGAQASLLLDADVLQTGGIVNAPTVGVTGSLNEDGGLLFGGTVNVAGGATLNSGVLHATNLNAAVTYTGGDLYTDSALTVSLPNPSFSGSIGSSNGLTVNAGNLVSTGTLYSGGSLTLNAGDFSQTAGVIGAHTNVSILASGAATQTGGTMEAGGTLLVRGFGSDAATVTFAGTIDAQTVQLIEPGYALSAVPFSLGGAYAVNVGPLVNVFHCPGCDSFTPSSSAAIVRPANPGLRPVTIRLDGDTLALGPLSADHVELHSVHATSQSGPLTALTLTGTAGYLGSPDQVPVYNPGIAQTRVAGVTPSDPAVLPFADATVSLINPGNNIFAINGYQAAGGFNLVDQPVNQTNADRSVSIASGLVLTGIVRAGRATDPLDATAEAAKGTDIGITTTGSAGALSVNGVLAGRTVTLGSSGPITETGTLVAETLTGSAPTASFSTPNQVANLGQFDAPSGFSLVNARDLSVYGKVSAASGNASIIVRSGTGSVSVPEGESGGTLTIALPPQGADATVTARNVTLSGVNVIASGLVGACSVGDAATGNLTIAATGGTITVNAGAILGGQTSAILTAPSGVQFQGGTLNAPTLAIDGLGLTSGLVFGNSVTLNRAASITGGTLNAGTLNTPNGLTVTGGALYAGNALSLNAGSTLDGQISSGGTLTINGGSIVATASLTAASVVINSSGDFQQQSGLIAAAGSVTVTAGGLIRQAAPGQIEAGDTILLRAFGTGQATIGGQLAAARIEVVEPGATLSFAPAPFLAADTHPLRGAATVTLGSLANSFDCPGCLPAVLPVSTVTPFAASPGANRPAFLRVDGGTVALGATSGSPVLAADGVELHSLGATVQVGSSLETLNVSGTAGYAGSGATLPVYTLPDAQTRTAAGYARASAAANGTATLDSPGNAIASVGTYQVRGDDASRGGLTLVTSTGLAVVGTVRAGPSSDPLDASAEAATGNAVALSAGPIQIGSGGLIAGSTVVLSSAAGISEAGGRIVAGTLSGTAGGNVALGTATTGAAGQGGNQIGTLSAFTSPGLFTLQNSRNLAVTGPVTAQNGLTITAQSGAGTASVAEGQAAGNLTLAGSVTSGTDAGLTAYGDLTGSSPTAPGTLTLKAGGAVRVSGIAAGSVTGTAGQSFDASGSFGTATSTSAVIGSLILSDAVPLVLGGTSRSQTDARITAPAITATGELDSAQSIQLHVTKGDFTQTGGTVAATNNLGISGASDTDSVAGRIVQQGGLLAAGGSLRLLATADALQGAGAVAAPVVQVASIFGLNTFGASQSASVSVPGAGLTLVGVVLPSFTLPTTTTATTLSGRPATVRLDGSTVLLTRLTAADTVELHAATNLSELSGGSITANTVLGSAGYAALSVDAQGLPAYSIPNGGQGGGASLGNANNILRLGPFDARSGFTLADTPSAGLTVTGTVRAGLPTSAQDASAAGAPLSIAVTGPSSNLTLGDNATLAGSQITLNTSGAITQSPTSLLLADTLSGSAASAALTPTNGNQVAHLGAFTTVGNLALLNAGDLQATGAVTAGPNLNLTSRGNLDVGGGSLAASTVTLTATGTITESGGSITTGSLTASAAQITARAPGNQIATTGALSADGGIDLVDAASLTTTGPITAKNGPVSVQSQGSLTTQGPISAPSITLSTAANLTTNGSIAASTGPVSLQSQGDLTTQGPVSAPSITLNSGGTTTLANTTKASADFSVTTGARLAFQGGSQTTANTITTQSSSATTLSGTMSASSTVNLRSSQSLTLAGAISSPLLTAGAPAITLQGGTITAGGTVQPSIVTAAKLPDAPNRSGAANATSGAFFQADNSFVQTGPTVISTTAGYPNTTVRVSLLSPSTAATVSLSSLNAPSTNLILDLQNGSGTGQNIRVANFIVSYAGTGVSPGIGSLNLTGVTVGSQVGTGAASAGVALANPSRTYQINACAVGSVNCVVLRPQAVPVGNPLKELSLSFFNDQDDDRDLLVPNITDQGL